MGQRKAITLYREADAPALEETDMMSAPVFPEDLVRPADADPADILAAQTIKVL